MLRQGKSYITVPQCKYQRIPVPAPWYVQVQQISAHSKKRLKWHYAALGLPFQLGSLRCSLCPSLSVFLVYECLCIKLWNTDIYYRAFHDDRVIRKVLVVWIFALETLQTAVVAHDAFVTYASGFGSLAALEHTHLAWLSVPVLSGVGQ